VAWLTVGAVVYGHRLAESPTAKDLFDRSAERRSRVPAPLRWLLSRLSAELRLRFTPLVDGLRLLFRSGLAAMLLFCLVYLVLSPVNSTDRGLLGGAGGWMWELERLVIGPQELNAVWLPASYMLSSLNGAVETVLLICLLGAAVDRVLRTQRHDRGLVVEPEVRPAPVPPPVPVGGPLPVRVPGPPPGFAPVPPARFAPAPVPPQPQWPPDHPYPPPGPPVSAG
jgi:hypothetical protein